jgi:hypothetical protein
MMRVAHACKIFSCSNPTLLSSLAAGCSVLVPVSEELQLGAIEIWNILLVYIWQCDAKAISSATILLCTLLWLDCLRITIAWDKLRIF